MLLKIKNKSALFALRGPKCAVSIRDCSCFPIFASTETIEGPRTSDGTGRKPWNSPTWCEAGRRERQSKSESQGRGLPPSSIRSARRKSRRSECSESWCHVKLAAPCVNMTLLHVPVLPSSVDFLLISVSKGHIGPSVEGAGNQKWGGGRGFLFCFAFFSPSIQIHLMNELRINLNLTQMRVLPHSHDLLGLIPIRPHP